MTLLDELSDAGLTVTPHGGWETATNSGMDRVQTVGVVNHWDAIKGWPGVGKYLANNRFGGILYHIVIRKSGVVHLLSQRYAWHAGQGSSQILATAVRGGPVPDDAAGGDDTNGNPHFFSVCVNYHPDDGPMLATQYDTLVTVNRVLVDHFNLVPGQVFRHMDWTTRKRDIDTIDLADFRTDIGEDDLALLTTDEQQQLKNFLAFIDEKGSNVSFVKQAIDDIRAKNAKGDSYAADDHDHDYVKNVTVEK